jgi:transcriptional regulator with XRE-family HTH domain
MGQRTTIAESADDVEARIRARLRATRTERGLSLEALGRRAGMSASLLSRLESGRRRLSVDHLAALARALEVSVDDLLSAPTEDDPRVHPVAHRTDDGTTFWSLSPSAAPGAPRAFKVRIPATRTRIHLAQHPGRDWLYVLSGRLRLQVGETVHELGPGEAAEFATTEPHGMAAVGGPVELLTLFGPLGEGVHLHPT